MAGRCGQLSGTLRKRGGWLRAELPLLALMPCLPEISTSTSILAPDRLNSANGKSTFFSVHHLDLRMCMACYFNRLVAVHVPIFSSYPVGGILAAEKQTTLTRGVILYECSLDDMPSYKDCVDMLCRMSLSSLPSLSLTHAASKCCSSLS